MPTRKGALTPQERTFAKAFANTQDGPYAASKAGYAQPVQRASSNLQKPGVLAEIRRNARRRLESEGAEVGVSVLVSIALDERQPGGTRVRAADSLLKHSGVSKADADAGKEPHEMNAEELARAIKALEDVAADRAKVVSGGADAASGSPGIFD